MVNGLLKLQKLTAQRVASAILVSLSLLSGQAFAADYVVTNSADSGAGSLPDAVAFANLNPGTNIVFNIPDTDPDYQSLSGINWWRIQLKDPLPTITADGTTIDGATQTAYGGDLNPLGPEIELDGERAGTTDGFLIQSANNVINDLIIDDFDANAMAAIRFDGAGATGNTVTGCNIGVGSTGSSIIPNTFGIYITADATDNQIGGTNAGEGNVISNNLDTGIFVMAANTTIQGNIIGLDPGGTLTRSNGSDGITLWQTTGALIGGTDAGARNIIAASNDAGNNSDGIWINGGSSHTIQGNHIGIDINGGSEPNYNAGVYVGGSSDNLIGGTAAGAGNIIANNGNFGIVLSSTAVNNSILGNSIYNSGGLGIDLDEDGVTANDLGDGDTGTNNGQNFPVLTTAGTNASSQVTVEGTLNSTASTTFRLEFFANTAEDPTGYGEGETYLGTTEVTTDGSGDANFVAPLSANVAVGAHITATATDPSGNTSEFAATYAATVAPNSSPTITSNGGGAAAAIDMSENAITVTTATATDPDSGDILTFSLSGGADITEFSITSAGELTFNSAPDYESPTDTGTDNVYEVSVQVDDGNGGTDTQAVSITVNNVSPTTISVTGTTTSNAGDAYTLNLSTNEDVLGWTINWGDGSISSLAGAQTSTTHTYANAGFTHHILASVSDSDGNWSENELIVPGFTSGTIHRHAANTGAHQEVIDTFGAVFAATFGPDGNLYVTGFSTHEVKRYDPATWNLIDTFVTAGDGGLDGPTDLAFGPDGNLYVASHYTDSVLRFDGSTGNFVDEFIPTGTEGLNGMAGICFGPNANLYIVDYFGDRILEFNGATGAFIGVFVDTGIDTPEGIAFGPDGNFYLANHGSVAEVRRYNGSTGVFIDSFVTDGSGSITDPNGLTFGPDGHLYVSSGGLDPDADDAVFRYDGTTGAFLDMFTSTASGGVDRPRLMAFVPGHSVTITGTAAISGLVFEDTDFAGTATGWDTGVADVAQANVDIELYDANNGDSYVASATTDGTGAFTFTGVASGTYKVRVRTATMGDADSLPYGGLNASVPATWPYPLAEMTWAHSSELIGGQDPLVDDTSTGDNAGPGDTWVQVSISGSDVTGINFGFCYDLIVSEIDDTNADSVRSTQGCFRQFIKNSNAIVGTNKSWFQIGLP